jgi:glycosyltransferase involved in cell wall biosynthesis
MAGRYRLLVIGPTPPPQHGVALAVQSFLNSQVGQAFEVHHLELADRRVEASVRKTFLSAVWLFFRQWSRLLWILLWKRPHFLYLFLSDTAVRFVRDSLFLWPAHLLGVRSIVHLYGGNLKEWYLWGIFPLRAYVRLVMMQITKVIVLGESIKEEVGTLVPKERIAVVPNGVDDLAMPRTRAEGDRPTRFKILHLSRLHKMKGALVLLSAIRTVLRTRENVEFIFAGPWVHAEHEREAQDYIERNDIKEWVTFTGEVTGPAKQALFASADLFVFPPIQQEGQPLVVLEAMAAGLPVIYTDRGCLRETVGDGEGGIETYVYDPYDLALRILWLLDRPEEMQRLAANARRRYEACYTSARHHDRLMKVLAEVVEHTMPPKPTAVLEVAERRSHP